MSSTLRKLVSGTSLTVFSMVASAIVSFCMAPFVISSLGDRLYGFWALMLSFLSYYGLLDLGLSSAVIRHVSSALGSKNERECNHIVNTAFILYLGVGCLVLLATAVLAASASLIISDPDDASLFWKVILIVGIGAAIGFPVKVFQGVLRSQLRYDIMAALSLISLTLRTVLIVFALLSGYKVLALACITVLSGVPEWVLSIYFAQKSVPSLRVNVRLWDQEAGKKLFSYSTYTLIIQISDLFRFNIDSLVIARFVGLAAVTHYNIAAVMVQHFLSLMIALLGGVQPLFSRQHGVNDKEAITKTFFIATRISIFAASFVGFGLIAWGNPFIQRWMGSEYVDAYPCLVVLVCGWVFDLWQLPSVALLYATSRHRFYALFNSIEGICNLLLSLLFVQYWGIFGVALGTFVPTAIIKLVIQPIYVCRVSSIQYSDYILMMAKTLRVVFLSLTVPLLLALRYAMPDYLNLTIWGLGSFGYYILVVWFIGLTREEKDALLQAVMPRVRIKRETSLGVEHGK